VERPLACPACGSAKVTTGSKTIDVGTYFSCGTCSHVWNPARRQLNERPNRWR
jgi:transcription elongation factor Elf1